jgi:transposase
MKRKHVTLLIVWDEYIAANPGGYSYSRFCELYRDFETKLSPTMRQTHAGGERLFVDYLATVGKALQERGYATIKRPGRGSGSAGGRVNL